MFDKFFTNDQIHTQGALEIEMRVRARVRELAMQAVADGQVQPENEQSAATPIQGLRVQSATGLKPVSRQFVHANSK